MNHLGSKTVGAINIGVAALSLPALLQYLAELQAQQAELLARLNLYVQVSATFTDPTALIAQLQAAIAALMSQIAAILAGVLPSLPTATASVNVEIGALLPKLLPLNALITSINAAISAGGIHAWSIDTTAAQLGGEVSAGVAGGLPGGGLPGARVRGVLFLTESAAAHAALGTLLLTG